MVEMNVTVEAEEGFHMRPAGVIAKEASKFNSDITIIYEGKRINAKSLVNIIASCIKKGANITIQCDGEDEKSALEKMKELAGKNFGE